MNAYDFTGFFEWNKIKGRFSLEKTIAIQQAVNPILSDSKVVKQSSFQDRGSWAIASVLSADNVLYCAERIKRSPEQQTMNLELTNLLEAFTKNIEQFGIKDKIYPLAMSTAEAAEKFEPESLDLLLLDTARDRNSVKLDLLQWYP